MRPPFNDSKSKKIACGEEIPLALRFLIEDGACLDSNPKDVNSESTADKSVRPAPIPRKTKRRDMGPQSITERGTSTVIVESQCQ